MAIIIGEIGKEKVEVRFTESEDEIIYNSLKDIKKEGSCYISNSTLWDCAGDIALTVFINRSENNFSAIKDKRIVLSAGYDKIKSAHFYSPETLLKIFSKLQDWKVVIEKSNMKEGVKINMQEFKIECPKFEGDNWNTNNKTQHDKIKRDYAHPIDSGIVKILDNKIVNSIFKQGVDMISDTTYGPVVASGVLVSKENYPEIKAIVDECVYELGIKRPYVIISSGVSGINAMTFGSDEEPYIAISPLMINTMSKEQLKFVIGHECGHIAMGHVVYHTVVNVASIFASAVPVIAPIINAVGTVPLMAWSRRSEISADRAGLLCCGDVETAKRTLLQITMPFMKADEINVDKYVKDSADYLKKGVLRKANELNHNHPIIPKRIHALDEFAKSEKYCRLTGKAIFTGAIADKELERITEEIIRVF